MAVYRFRVTFEDYDDILREIDVRTNQTFEDLHFAIHQTTGYPAEKPSSFYVANDQWLKSDEIAFMPSQRKVDNGVAIMIKSKLSNFIDDPHQKFYYTYNFERPYDFHVELIKILLEDEKNKDYPCIFRSVGEAPRPPGSAIVPIIEDAPNEFDFLNELEYAPEDADDLETVDDIESPIAVQEEEEEKDEFMDEFSDNDSIDPEDLQKEDY